MAQNDWAIVIGINEYEHHPERNLHYAVNDATAIRDLLCNYAQFPEDQVFLCLGEAKYKTENTYPNTSNLSRWLEIELQPDKIGKADRFWFFFSGHGLSRNGTDYLIPCDSLQNNDKLLLSVPEVIAALRRHERADIVLILDNCRETADKSFNACPFSEETKALAKQRGVTTLFSCDYAQFSYELAQENRGAFTYALVEGLKQHTLPSQLERYVQRRVAQLNRANGIRGLQTPKILLDSAQRGVLSLLPECVTAADVEVLREQARDAELEGHLEDSERIWWQVIQAPTDQRYFAEGRKAVRRIYRKTLLAETKAQVSQELDQLRRKLQEAEQRLQASEGQQAELGQVQQERDRLQQALQAAEQRLQGLVQEQGNAGQLRQEKADLERQLEQVRAEAVQQAQAAQEEAQNEAQNTINQLKERLQEVQTQLEAGEKAKQEALAVQAEQANQIKTLKQKIHTLEQRLKAETQAPSAPTPAMPQQTWDIDAVPLNSEGGKVDYTRLRDLLKAGQWKEADQETYKRMLEATGRTKDGYFRSEDLQNFPCADLKTIDKLWVQASQGRYGFSVQKEIYVKSGGKLDGSYPGDRIWRKFGDAVGWRVNGSWLGYGDLNWGGLGVSGHLPLVEGVRRTSAIYGLGVSLLSHRDLQTVADKAFQRS